MQQQQTKDITKDSVVPIKTAPIPRLKPSPNCNPIEFLKRARVKEHCSETRLLKFLSSKNESLLGVTRKVRTTKD